MNYTFLFIIIFILTFATLFLLNEYLNKVSQLEVQEQEEPQPQLQTPYPYWMYYGQPTYWPAYLSPYWYYNVPFNGPVTNPWGPSGRHSYRPGHGSGYSGVAVGGGGGGGHGGH